MLRFFPRVKDYGEAAIFCKVTKIKYTYRSTYIHKYKANKYPNSCKMMFPW